MLLEPLHKLILEFLEKTDRPIFLTGKAGTGKTTFLRYIRQTTKKNLAVVAPTAVAAINAGGVTIHSFFQVPFGPIPPPNEVSRLTEFSAKSFGIDKTKLIKCLDLLIIDEISMVRSDTLDYIDRALRFIKGSNRPFGGVQLLMIGDLYQLPPVFQNDWHLLGRFYKGPYFFDSIAFKTFPLLTFELNKVHRQSDPQFVEILNQIRNGNISQASLDDLNKHYNANPDEQDLTNHVTLTTHNPLVKAINEERLDQLPGETFTFKANVTGDFPTEAYPTDDNLVLKQGAMVMFIKNDSSGEKKYYNGRTAKIESIEGDNINVQFLDDGSVFEATRENWENTKYTLSETDQKVNQTSAGSFAQFPLRLAWAITIHKSQGLTFDQAVIDVSAAFAHGQTYVALSRCRSLQGLILKQKVSATNIITDPAVAKFMESAGAVTLDNDLLKDAILETERLRILDFFDFGSIRNGHQQFKRILSELLSDVALVDEKTERSTNLIEQKIYQVAERFIKKELAQLIQNKTEVYKRIQKASAYFSPLLTDLLGKISLIHQSFVDTPFHPEYFPTLNQLLEQVENKAEVFKILEKNIDFIEVSLNMKTMAASYKQVDGWKKKVSIVQDIENPILHAQLENWRKRVAEEKKVLTYHILSDIALAEISAKLPRSLTALSKIKNVGEGKVGQYGDELIKIIKSHLGENDLFG
ncbi:MAG: helicase [Pedobacter sp.]|nr:MAG: helicase [Pedobacter sp.]